MPFPISARGFVSVDGNAVDLPDEAIILACVDQIEHEGARIVVRHADAAAFKVPVFMTHGWGWSFTRPLSGGSFQMSTVSDGTRVLSYKLSLGRNALIGTVLVVGMFGFIAPYRFGPAFRVPWQFMVAAWLWIVGGNYAFAALRARSWCRRRLLEAKVAVSIAQRTHPDAST